MTDREFERVVMDMHRRRLEVEQFLIDLPNMTGMTDARRQEDVRIAIASRRRITAQMQQVCKREGRLMPADDQLPKSVFACPSYNHSAYYDPQDNPDDPWRLPQEFWECALGLAKV